MNSSLCAIILLLVSGLTACDKQASPAKADMDAETRQKAVEIREAADKEAAALKEAAAIKEAARKAAAAKEALAPDTAPAPAPPK